MTDKITEDDKRFEAAKDEQTKLFKELDSNIKALDDTISKAEKEAESNFKKILNWRSK